MTDDSGGASATVAEPSAGGFDEPMPDTNRPSLHGSKSVDAVHPAEQFCLNRVGASPHDILHMISLLDSELPSRGKAGPNTFSWTSGAYAKGPLRGLRKHSKIIFTFLKQLFPRPTRPAQTARQTHWENPRGLSRCLNQKATARGWQGLRPEGQLQV